MLRIRSAISTPLSLPPTSSCRAVETLGTINRECQEFLLEIGRRGADVYSDPGEIVYLLQRLSICTQRFIRRCFWGTFTPYPGDVITSLKKIKGVTLSETLSVSDHVSNILRSCTSSIYALKTLTLASELVLLKCDCVNSKNESILALLWILSHPSSRSFSVKASETYSPSHALSVSHVWCSARFRLCLLVPWPGWLHR